MTEPETVYSSVIWYDGIIVKSAGPWKPWEHEVHMMTLGVVSRDREDIDKQFMDVMCFGMGMVHVSPNGIRHIPVSEWRI